MVSRTTRYQKVSRITRKKTSTTNHNLIIGNCLDALADKKILKNESIDLIVTSPPYGLEKKYGKYSDRFNIEKWTSMIEQFGANSHRVLKPHGSIFLNISPIPEPKNKEIFPLDAYAYFALKKSGYSLRNKIIWHFNNMQNCTNRLSGRWETILWFVKDITNYKFNLDEIRLPYITKKDKRLEGGPGRNPTDVWYFDRINNMTKNKLELKHPTVYPDKMIERIIIMSSDKGDTILDPFVGSGTSMKVAKNLKRNSFGIEIDSKYRSLIRKRMSEEKVGGDYKLTVSKYEK
tara:strand:+ start:2576 stop:3445 length:870 start_codon:yes stop_codon:yes gene_type:complete